MAEKRIFRLNEISELEKLDKYDKRIIEELSQNSRQPYSKIAKKIRLSRDSVEYRVQKLVDKGIILSFVPIINLNHFGYDTFHVFFIINDANSEKKDQLLSRLINHSNTKSLMEYTDKWDLEWVVVARTLQEFDDIITEITTEFHDVIIQKNKLEIIKGYKSIHLPESFYKNQRKKIQSVKDLKSHITDIKKHDKTDLMILNELSKHSRMSSYEIGEKLKLSSNAVRNRIKRMVEDKIIWQFSVIVNLAMLKLHWYSVNVELKTFNKDEEKKYKQFVNDNPYIIRSVKVLGSWDLLNYIAAPSMKDFHLTVKEMQEEFVDQIYNYETLIAYKERIFRALPPTILRNYK